MSEEKGPAVGTVGDQGPARVGTLLADDPRMQPAAKNPRRMEMVVAGAFVVSALCLGSFGAVYWIGGQPQAEGTLLGVGLGALGFGLSAWGKYLMPRGPFVEERHLMATSEEDKAAFAAAFDRGVVAVKRRSFLGKLLGAAMGIFGVVATFPLVRSLGPQPGSSLFHTTWSRGKRLVGLDGRPINVADMEVGGALTVFPEGDVGSSTAQTILLRAGASDIVTQPGRETWGPLGYLAYSKVCTHAGCPVGLYEEQYQQLLCPCHQSLFDVLNGAQPVFGPAPRPLPQLPLMVDEQGYLAAQSDYHEPIGPGFWER
ncbi:MAG TPA: ubiquinol-cytochrome c reductase iron-sulfur subunit [Acidimicrobiales bacterium]|nr:ubiquinol-cytochrome c reductase iron-sulfur subunit [Acidimicrobiales bacterium]